MTDGEWQATGRGGDAGQETACPHSTLIFVVVAVPGTASHRCPAGAPRPSPDLCPDGYHPGTITGLPTHSATRRSRPRPTSKAGCSKANSALLWNTPAKLISTYTEPSHWLPHHRYPDSSLQTPQESGPAYQPHVPFGVAPTSNSWMPNHDRAARYCQSLVPASRRANAGTKRRERAA